MIMCPPIIIRDMVCMISIETRLKNIIIIHSPLMVMTVTHTMDTTVGTKMSWKYPNGYLIN